MDDIFQQRKACNFYRSYWLIAQEIEDLVQRCAYYDAVLKYEFTGEKIELEGIVKFAFKSQEHSLDKQVVGYVKGKSTPTPTPPRVEDPIPSGGNSTQVQEKEQGQVQEEIIHEIPKAEIKKPKFSQKERTDQFLKFFNESLEKHKGELGKFRTLGKTDVNNLNKLREVYTSHADWITAFDGMIKAQWVIENNMATPAHYLRNENFQKYLNAGNQSKKFKAPWD